MTSALVLAAWVALAPAQASAPSARLPAAQREAVVLSAVENMYSGPDASKDVVSQALLGQVVGVVEEKDGFVRIETPDRYRGWVPVAALFPYPDPAAPRYARRGTGRRRHGPHGEPLSRPERDHRRGRRRRRPSGRAWN